MSETAALAAPPSQAEIAMKAEAVTWAMKAEAITIVDDETNREAGEFLVGIKARLKTADGHYDPLIEQAHKTHKAILLAKAAVTEPLKAGEFAIKLKIGDYQAIQAERRRLEQIRLETEARRQQEEARLAEALALEAAGDKEAAQATLEAPPEEVAVYVPQAPKVAGVSVRESWSCSEVIDLNKLLEFCFKQKEWRHLMIPNMAVLNGLARAQKASFSIPGCKAVRTNVVSGRG